MLTNGSALNIKAFHNHIECIIGKTLMLQSAVVDSERKQLEELTQMSQKQTKKE